MGRFEGRRLDQIWFVFLFTHIWVTLFVDLQPLYPPELLKGTPFPLVLNWYISLTRDPILIGAIRGGQEWDWLRTFFCLEGSFQMLSFVLGSIGLWKNDQRVYPLLLAYGASTATTLVPVLNAVLTDPHSKPPLNGMELAMLLSSYIPFLVIPLGIAIDMGVRLCSIIGDAQAATLQKKRK